MRKEIRITLYTTLITMSGLLLAMDVIGNVYGVDILSPLFEKPKIEERI